MPVFNQYVNDGQGVRIIYEGNVTFDEIIKSQIERYNPPDKLALYKYYLHDLSFVDGLNLTSDEVRNVAEGSIKASKINPNLIVAAIVHEDFHYGMARMYGAYAEETGWDMKAFRSCEEAEAWVKERVQVKFGMIFESV